jgi:hypothetical protein
MGSKSVKSDPEGEPLMHYSPVARLALLSLLALAPAVLHAAEGDPGTTGAVAKWSSQEMDTVKSIGLPVCMYVYQNFKKANADATFLEGKEFLEDPEVQKALKKFHCVKIDVTRSTTIPKSWPREMVEKFKAHKFAVILMDSDLRQQFVFKKKAFDAMEANPKALIATAERIAKEEEKKKAIEKKAEKEEKDVVEAQPKTVGKVPGLADPNDKDKDGKDKPAKKEPPKPAKQTGPADE